MCTDKRELRSGRLLPEHVDLGLRLTVGEGLVQRPFLESSRGNGHFPEMSAQTEPVPDAYFPALAGIPSGEAPGATSDYVCSPQTTIVASIISVIAMNLVLIVSFVVFYRYQRRRWMQKGAMDSRIRPVSSRIHPQAVPPPLPSRPSTASGALGPSPPVYNSSSSSEVLYKDPRFQPSERNFGLQRMSSGLGASSMTSLPRS